MRKQFSHCRQQVAVLDGGGPEPLIEGRGKVKHRVAFALKATAHRAKS